VWEESDEENGLKRWTDGKTFGQSRMRGDFLFYEEKIDGQASPPRSPTTMWSSSVMRAEQGYPFVPTNETNPNALIKQTYSAFFPSRDGMRQIKWHMTAYFVYADLPRLPTCDTDPILRHLVVPPNFYRSGKARSRASGDSDRSTPTSPKPAQYQAWPGGAPTLRPGLGPEMRRATTDAVPRAQTQSGLPTIKTGSNSPSSVSRGPEDQRVIHLLNSKTLL